MYHKLLWFLSLCTVLLLTVSLFVSCGTPKEAPADEVTEDPAASDEPVAEVLPETSFPYYNMSEECAPMISALSSLIMDSVENNTPPFSFDYDGVPSSEFLASWTKDIAKEATDAGESITVTYADPETQLKAILKATLYNDLPSAEWVVYFENGSSTNSKKISNVKSMDLTLPVSGSVQLNTTTGTNSANEQGDQYDFSPLSFDLSSSSQHFSNTGGRSAECAWPFFDIVGENSGYVLAVGWTGAWEADFSAGSDAVHATAGRQFFDAYLLPGESVRMPSTVITYFEGDAEYGHNLWRHTVTNHYTPEVLTSGEQTMPISIMTWGGESEETLQKIALSHANLELGTDTLWVDAGWHGDVIPESNGTAAAETWKYNVGNWRYNQYLYPNGDMSALGTVCEENDLDFLQWFELERAYANTETLIMNPDLFYDYETGNNYLLRLDTQEGYDYMFSYLCQQIETNKLDIYRQDFNIQPIEFWNSADEEGRTGITETYYITNLYKLFDALSEKYPYLLIDNCASGGRRLDIEMTKRSVPLFRTDYTTHKDYCSEEMIQAQTQSISYWLPLTGTGFGKKDVKAFNDYTMLSYLSPAVSLPNAIDNPTLYQRSTAVYEQAQNYWTGDYYSLMDTAYNSEANQAYELFRHDLDSGMAVVYIRPDSAEKTVTVQLKGLTPDAAYVITQPMEETDPITMTGEELMTTGLTFEATASAAYAVFFTAVQ